MTNKTIGLAITGSFCTFEKLLPELEKLAKHNTIIPIFSYSVAKVDTRFYKAEDFYNDVKKITNQEPIRTIKDAEPIGPKNFLDLIIIAPCTGNTLAKLNNGITDTPVLMAVKAHLRNNKPVLVAISTNDGLAANARNIGELINKKNIFFTPFAQDNYQKKRFSLMADFDLLIESAEAALNNQQLQPVLKGV
ncbi:MAG: dipicolinate synthase subunit B [Bacillota bacterium]|jgi:dipicolinate synthase subunit B|nr:dipicolinate synthase subunit B [Bacillota bacterium]HHU43393.1 dipicolinate synthase subunit B [Clostridiales bacterium]